MKRRISAFVLLLVLSVPGMVLRASSAGSEGPRRVEITARRFTFDPGVITLKKGQPVVLVLKSADVPHGLRFRELGVEIKVPKGGTSQVQFTPDKEGDFVGHCSVFCGEGHGTMALTLHVVS